MARETVWLNTVPRAIAEGLTGGRSAENRVSSVCKDRLYMRKQLLRGRLQDAEHLMNGVAAVMVDTHIGVEGGTQMQMSSHLSHAMVTSSLDNHQRRRNRDS